MATGTQVIECLAPRVGLLPTTLERQLRAQRQAGQLPTGGPGGGRASAHFEAPHLVAVLFGLVGPLPSDAPEAVVTLRTLLHRYTHNPPQGVSQPLPTLEDQLADWIRLGAEAYRGGKAATDACYAVFRTMKLMLCLNPRNAIITVGPADPNQTTIVYAAGQEMPFALQRVTCLSGELVIAAAELLADTTEQLDAIACVQFLGKTQPAKSGPGQKSAEASAKRPRRVANPA